MALYTAVLKSEIEHIKKHGYGQKLVDGVDPRRNAFFDDADTAIAYCSYRGKPQNEYDTMIVLSTDEPGISRNSAGISIASKNIPASKLNVEVYGVGQIGSVDTISVFPSYTRGKTLTYVIGTVISQNNTGKNSIGYRVIDVATNKIEDIKSKKRILSIDCVNYYLNKSGDKLIEVNGEDSNYPIINSDTGKVSHNRIVILYEASGGKYLVTDGTGKIRWVSKDQIVNCDQTMIANLKSFQELMNPETAKRLSLGGLNGSNVEPKDEANLAEIELRKKLYKTYRHSINSLPWDLSVAPGQCADMVSEVFKNWVPDLKAKGTKDEANYEQNNTFDSSSCGEYEILTKVDGDRVIAIGIKPSNYDGDVVIPDGITHIDEGAFKKTKFKRIKFADSVVHIGEEAFLHSSVEVVYLSKNVKAIPHYCFYCSNLAVIDLSNITSIGNYAFCSTHLKRVELNKDVVQIGIEAFKQCLELATVKHGPNLRKIRTKAFFGCCSLSEFDFDGISEIETEAFNGVALTKADLKEGISYIQSFTFVSPVLSEVILGPNSYKLADRAFVSEIPITYTMPKEISNVGVSLIKPDDTVRCYHNTIAESSAKLAKCNIEYLDNAGNVNKSILKASMVGLNIPDLIIKTIKNAYDKDDADYDYDIDTDCNLVSIPLSDDMLKFIGLKSVETPEGYTEKSKFKVLLEHYAKSCPPDGVGLSSNVLRLSGTISVSGQADPIYDDGISRVYELVYSDHKYESKKAKYILAITGNTVRYCCLNNRNTDLYCKTQYSKAPGDTIGYNCTIAGKSYDCIATKVDGVKTKNNEPLSLNIYQALFNCSITVKLERNHLAIILPVNGKVLKCASLGKAVWNNENDESYKTKYCVIEDIQDLKGNTIFEYGVNSPARDDELFSLIRSMDSFDIDQRIRDYSHIGVSAVTPYCLFQEYCRSNNITKLHELDLKGLGYLLAFPILEKRTERWLDASIGKTIVDAAKSKFDLAGELYIRQYVTVKRVATYNKLITGGDRTLYIFAVYYRNSRILITSSLMDLDTLFEMGISLMDDMNTLVGQQEIYKDPTKFDVVKASDMIKLTELFVNRQDKVKGDSRPSTSVYLTVYKPTGRYYVTYISFSKNLAIPIIQVGSFDVVTDYVDCATSKASTGYNEIYNSAEHVIYSLNASKYSRNYGYGYSKPRAVPLEYTNMLKARELCINGVTDIKPYMDIGISPVICHMFGVLSTKTESEIAEEEKAKNIQIEDDGFEISGSVGDGTGDDSDRTDLDELIDMDDFDIDEGDQVDIGEEVEDSQDEDIEFDDLDMSDLEAYGEYTDDSDISDEELAQQAAKLNELL